MTKIKMNTKHGFTLVEMLVVVAIIAILVSITLVAINNSVEKAKEATDLSNIRNACSEMQTINLSNEGYDKTRFEKYKASDGTNYMKTYVNCVSRKEGWQVVDSAKKVSGTEICGATLYAPTSNKPVVRVRLNLDTGVIDFNPEVEDKNNQRICVYNR